MDIIATHKTSSIIVLQYQNNAFMQNLLIVSRYIWNLYFISGSACYVSIYCLHCTLAIILHACLENLLMLCKFKTVFLNFICQQCGVEHLFICVLWSNITYIVPIKKEIYISMVLQAFSTCPLSRNWYSTCHLNIGYYDIKVIFSHSTPLQLGNWRPCWWTGVNF